MRLPIRARLTILFAIIVVVVIGATGSFVYFQFQRDLLSSIDTSLQSRAETLLAGVDRAGRQFSREGTLIESDEAFAQIMSASGEVLETSRGIENEPLLATSTIAQLTRPTYFVTRVETFDERLPARLFAIPSEEGPIVIVGASLDDIEEAASELLSQLLFGGAGALVLTVVIGWVVSGAALRPVESMRVEAEAISADEPGRRLPIPNTGDEIARLGQTLNAMLARIEQAIERERRFVDDASHEIRTPLGILKTEIELALRRSRSAEELEAALRSAAEESDRLNALAEDLLVLARADRGGLPVRREELDLGELVTEVAKRLGPEGEARKITIAVDVDGSPRADVDPQRIRQAVENLLDNALRHAPDDSSVTVRVTTEPDGTVIEVGDEGAGFPPYFIDHAFDPFTRADRGRTRSVGGAGLGLAIVRAIAEGHGGHVQARNAPHGGAVVSMQLPSSKP